MCLFCFRGCGLPCNKRPELQCLSDSMFADVIEFHTLAVPSGIPAYQVSEIYFFFFCIFFFILSIICVGLGFWVTRVDLIMTIKSIESLHYFFNILVLLVSESIDRVLLCIPVALWE